MENIIFHKGLINSTDETITIYFARRGEKEVKESVDIKVSSDENDEFILNLIDLANRHYSVTVFNINKSDEDGNYGCISSKVLGLDNMPLTLMNVKYMINLFLNLVQCLLFDDDDDNNNAYCRRDIHSIKIPTTDQNINNLINDVITNCINNNDNNNNNNDDIDIKDLFLIVLQYMSSLSASNVKKINNNNNMLKKCNIAGGIPRMQELLSGAYKDGNFLKSSINETLHQTGNMIHNLIHEYKHLIIQQSSLCHQDSQAILKWIEANPNLLLYQNTNISCKFMMQFICHLFNVLFIEILPQTTMINCLYATLYQASVLNELNILKYHSKYIQIPLIYKLIYSFYKTEQKPEQMTNIDIDHSIITLIDKLCQTKTEDESIKILCQIALKINIQNTNQMNEIFWLLNEKRGYTFEFYIIVLIAIFIMSKCQNLNKINKLFNSQTFISPLYNILNSFYKFVVYEINNLKMALCDQTLDNFSKLYSTEIMNCFKIFSKNIINKSL